MTRSAIYAGDVMHTRLRPREHRLHYRVFSLLLDLDEMPGLSRSLRMFGYNRPAVFSFHDKDHGDGTADGLRAWVERQLAEAGLALEHPRIEVLCYPRIFGYVFNPLTVYFCRDGDGTLRAVLYEVCNTYGERRTYVIPTRGEDRAVRQACPKLHFVSPFLPMDLSYDFLIKPPGEKVLVRVDDHDGEGLLLRASFSGRRREMTDRTLLGVLFGYPLMTLKITAAIHWEAFRLWRKGIPVFAHTPATARAATTVVRPESVPDHAARDRELERAG